MSFSWYLQLQFFNRLRLRAGHYKIPAQQQAVNVACHVKKVISQMLTINELLYKRGLPQNAKTKFIRHADIRFPLYDNYKFDIEKFK